MRQFRHNPQTGEPTPFFGCASPCPRGVNVRFGASGLAGMGRYLPVEFPKAALRTVACNLPHFPGTAGSFWSTQSRDRPIRCSLNWVKRHETSCTHLTLLHRIRATHAHNCNAMRYDQQTRRCVSEPL